MKQKRPVNLALMTFHYPITAIVSILHRISGILVFLFLPFAIWGLQMSLESEMSFSELRQCFHSFTARFFLWLLLSGLAYHFFAGIRHMLLDIHIGESKSGGRCGAMGVALMSIILIIIMGIWLW